MMPQCRTGMNDDHENQRIAEPLVNSDQDMEQVIVVRDQVR